MRFTVQLLDKRSTFLDNLLDYLNERVPVSLGIQVAQDEATTYVFVTGATTEKLNFPRRGVLSYQHLGDEVLQQINGARPQSLDHLLRDKPGNIAAARLPGESDADLRKRLMSPGY